MSVVDIKAPREFDTLDILAAAVAIYEHNKGYHKNRENIITEDGKSSYVRFSNREILRHQFQLDYYSSGNGVTAPPLVKVYDRHFDKAKEIREYSKKELFNVLNNQQGYTTDLYNIINHDTTIANSFGFIASAPFYYDNGVKRDFYKDKINDIQSQHVGLIGTKVYLTDFEIIKNNKSNNYPGWIVQGICEGNLFLFFSRHEGWGKLKHGDVINIDGIVKDHVMEQSTIPMTKLNKVYERFDPSSIPNSVKVQPINGINNLFTDC